MANVLIIGCGDTGSRLAQILVLAGHAVTGVRRSHAAIPGVAMAQADITRPFRLDISAPDYVFILLSPDESSREGYERTFLTGLENIRTALESWSLKRVFFVSSTSVYGEDSGEWVNEETPPRPKGFNGEVLLQAEALACLFWPTTVVRFAGIYGEGRLRLLKWVENGRPVNPGMWSNRIHVADAARLLAFLMEQHRQGRELEEVYLGVDDCPVLQAEVLDWLAGRMEMPAVPRQQATESGANRRIGNGRILRLGFRFCYPDYQAGYAAVMASLRSGFRGG